LASPAPAADSPVADAAERQNQAAIRRLVDSGADVNAPQRDGTTALHWAAHWDDREVAALLIQAGARVNAATDEGITPQLLAAINPNSSMLDLLLRAGADPNMASVVGETPLMTAAQTGNIGAVKLLLAHGAAVDGREKSAGQTVLMRAVAANQPAIAKLLIAAGADVKARSNERFSPLLFAAQQGNLESVKLLLDAGADPNESAPDGIGGDTNARLPYKPNTEAGALLVAIDSAPEREEMLRTRRGDLGSGDSTLNVEYQAHQQVAMYLLKHGADPNEKGAGRTPLHSAIQRAMPELVQMLIDHGADVNARIEKPLPAVSRLGVPVPLGSTPFMLAANYTNLEIMRILLKAGADPKLRSRDQTTALMLAAGVNMLEGMDKYGRRWFREGTAPLQQAAQDTVELCLEVGLDVNAVNSAGQSAIMAGVYFGGTAMTQFLVDHGANINVKNKKGQTPYSVAAFGEYHAGSFMFHKDTAALLEKLGADTHLGVAGSPDADPQ
jgi:ankyrin repeat protein